MNTRLLAFATALVFCAGTAIAQTAIPKKDKDKDTVPMKKIEPKKQNPGEGEKKKEEAKPAAKLVVGSDAPKLSGEKWIKGNEVKGFDSGKVYVVEFWATWCGPCIDQIPHLTSLQKKHKDLTIIGMAASESVSKNGKDEREAAVTKFVKSQGSKMDYRVCFDSDRSMSNDWMTPAGQGGIPCSFVVNGEGKIAYIGHPGNDKFEKAIEKALADAKAKPAKKTEKPTENAPKEEKKKTGFLDAPLSPIALPAFAATEPPTETVPDMKKDDEAKTPAKAPAKEKKEKAAKPQPLSAGDKAPELVIGEWVKGEPVTGFEKGRVYVVEFWATWCGPCITSIPHLSEMNTKFKSKGVTFIGISDETTAKVKPFVEKMGEKMNYTVALDKKNGTNEAYMKAAGQGGIPTAFVVDKEGKIAWIGHPMVGLEKVIGKVLDGTFDPKKEAENAKKAEKLQEQLAEAFEGEEWDKFLKLADEVIALDSTQAPSLNAAKFRALLLGKKDYPAAYAIAGKLADTDFKDNAEGLNEIAWTIVDEPGVEKRDIDLAMRIATRACDITKFENGAILDTLARCHYEKKDLAKAVEFQTKAVEKSDKSMRTELKATLRKYEAELNKK